LRTHLGDTKLPASIALQTDQWTNWSNKKINLCLARFKLVFFILQTIHGNQLNFSTGRSVVNQTLNITFLLLESALT